MKKSIIITSIFEPTEAVQRFAKIPDHELIVVGDKKSPEGWAHENVKYLSVEDQEELNFNLHKDLPYNHYCRKMLGYLYAMKNGCDCIIDTDDDNIPNENWTFPEQKRAYDFLQEDMGFVNIYQLFTDQKIWPRGLPLDLISKDFKLEKHLDKNTVKVGVWQGLADEDPDVDAVYRLTNGSMCHFQNREPVVLGKGTISPFNSQNTMIYKEFFPLLYLPSHVTFRFTDILRGLIFQPIMWQSDYHLGFLDATVVQKRNPHDYMKDFVSEIPMYQHCHEVIEIVDKAISSSAGMVDNLHRAYLALLDHSIVKPEEIATLESWLKDVENIWSS